MGRILTMRLFLACLYLAVLSGCGSDKTCPGTSPSGSWSTLDCFAGVSEFGIYITDDDLVKGSDVDARALARKHCQSTGRWAGFISRDMVAGGHVMSFRCVD